MNGRIELVLWMLSTRPHVCNIPGHLGPIRVEPSGWFWQLLIHEMKVGINGEASISNVRLNVVIFDKVAPQPTGTNVANPFPDERRIEIIELACTTILFFVSEMLMR